MVSLKATKRRALIKRLKEFGFDGPHPGGKHPYMIKGDLSLTIPNDHKEDVGEDLLKRILKQAGITARDWLGK